MEAEEQPEQVKLVVVGDGDVGKTSLLISYATNCFPKEYVPTVFDDYYATISVEGQPLRLYLCDSAGQVDYDKIRPLQYPQTDTFLICFSVANKDSYDNIFVKWIPELDEHCPNVPRIIVGCKTDLRQSQPGKCLSKLELEEKFAELGLQYCETSALLKEGIGDCFDAAIIRACMYAFEPEEVDTGSEYVEDVDQNLDSEQTATEESQHNGTENKI